jgi:hypothetical protein
MTNKKTSARQVLIPEMHNTKDCSYFYLNTQAQIQLACYVLSLNVCMLLNIYDR